MRILSLLAILCMALTTTTFAQKTDMDRKASDYERIIQSNYEVEFRKLAVESMDLTAEQIDDFTPIYMAYMDEKSELMDRRRKLVKEHREEMQENQAAKESQNENADFIENYWELDIKQMELKKDYFDKLEDVIPYQKAITFFLLEEAVESDMNGYSLVEIVPNAVQVRRPYVVYQREMDDYNTWMINIEGEVDLDHDYTRDGLYKLVNATAAIAKSEKVKVKDMDGKATKIKMLADGLQKDWRSTDHADKTREAFVMTANLLKSVQQSANYTALSTQVNELEKAATMIDPAKKMTDQSKHVHNFFEKAQKVVNAMAKEAQMKSARG